MSEPAGASDESLVREVLGRRRIAGEQRREPDRAGHVALVELLQGRVLGAHPHGHAALVHRSHIL